MDSLALSSILKTERDPFRSWKLGHGSSLGKGMENEKGQILKREREGFEGIHVKVSKGHRIYCSIFYVVL